MPTAKRPMRASLALVAAGLLAISLPAGGGVVIKSPEGQMRQFLFVKGKAIASDQPEKLSVERRGDVSVLSLGENVESYEIVDALVVGG
jgi:hypothetical protein